MQSVWVPFGQRTKSCRESCHSLGTGRGTLAPLRETDERFTRDQSAEHPFANEPRLGIRAKRKSQKKLVRYDGVIAWMRTHDAAVYGCTLQDRAKLP